jgi:hypothetical protein
MCQSALFSLQSAQTNKQTNERTNRVQIITSLASNSKDMNISLRNCGHLQGLTTANHALRIQEAPSPCAKTRFSDQFAEFHIGNLLLRDFSVSVSDSFVFAELGLCLGLERSCGRLLTAADS